MILLCCDSSLPRDFFAVRLRGGGDSGAGDGGAGGSGGSDSSGGM